jgi:DNA processing protein
MESQDELVSWIQLLSVPGIGVGLFHRLLQRFGHPRQVFQVSLRDLADVPGISPRLASAILRSADGQTLEEAVREIERAREAAVTILTMESPGYPERVRTIFGPPPLIYCRGNTDCLSEPCVAMVGTRRATSSGLRTAEALAADLAGAGITVVSGLARGIDSACHEGALRAEGRTAAILGNGLGFELPKERRKLVERILERGALLSEFPMEMAPRPENFPRRNRIISGLSEAAVVVEAGERSGALITASFASEQGREVFAVPGRITDPQSAGCNLLIRDGASPVLDAADIHQAVLGRTGGSPKPRVPAGKRRGGIVTPALQPEKKKIPPLNEDEAKIYEILEGDSKHVDEVTRHCGIPPHRVAQILLSLELKGAVVRESGMRYVRS